MSNKQPETGLDRRMFGKSLREWSGMTEAERLADPKVGSIRLKALNDALASASGSSSAATVANEPAAPAEVSVVEPTAEIASPVTELPTAENAAAEAEAVAPPPEPVIESPREPVVQEPLMVRVQRELAKGQDPVGHVSRNPTVKLTSEQACLQSRLYAVLTAEGVKLRTQGDVYGFLLDMMAEKLA